MFSKKGVLYILEEILQNKVGPRASGRRGAPGELDRREDEVDRREQSRQSHRNHNSEATT